MSITMRLYVTSDLSEQETTIRGRGPTRHPNRTTYLILLISLLSFLIGFSGCAGTDTKSEITLPPSEKLDQYLQTADHLTEKQKKDMAARRPFIGMTIDEANLAMRQESTKLVLSGKAMQAVYVGESGVRYNIYFQGDPLRVADWSYFSEDQIELLDPDKLRPTPPVRTF